MSTADDKIIHGPHRLNSSARESSDDEAGKAAMCDFTKALPSQEPETPL